MSRGFLPQRSPNFNTCSPPPPVFGVGYIKRAVFGAVEHVTSVVELKYWISSAVETIIPEILKYVCRFKKHLGMRVCTKLTMIMELKN
jgi:hypothetical protein